MGHIRDTLKAVYATLSPTYRSIRRVEERTEELSRQMQRHFDRLDDLFWCARATSGISMSQVRKDFFHALPPAEGTLREIQLGCNYLLRQLKRICEANGIPYWISFGTLLGAARHGGFIPWDDDIDVSFLRADFVRFRQVLDEQDTFVLRPYYDEQGPYYLYKMVFRGFDGIFWVDITVWDGAETGRVGKDAVWEQVMQVRQKVRAQMIETSLQFPKRYHSEPLSEEDDAALQNILAAHRTAMPSGEHPDCIYRSLDSVYLGGETLLRLDEVFPLRELPFEGETYPVPNGYETYLEQIYHYLELPSQFHPSHAAESRDLAERVEAQMQALQLREKMEEHFES